MYMYVCVLKLVKAIGRMPRILWPFVSLFSFSLSVLFFPPSFTLEFSDWRLKIDRISLPHNNK